jgi:hypothetical protein
MVPRGQRHVMIATKYSLPTSLENTLIYLESPLRVMMGHHHDHVHDDEHDPLRPGLPNSESTQTNHPPPALIAHPTRHAPGDASDPSCVPTCRSHPLLDRTRDLPGVYEAEARGDRQGRDEQPEAHKQQDGKPEEVEHAILCNSGRQRPFTHPPSLRDSAWTQ